MRKLSKPTDNKAKDSEILGLKTKRDEHVRQIETNVITELRKVFNDSVVQ